METSIFTKIINGDIPCYKIYEDENTVAFLDIHPVQPGHTLVVPKVQIDHFEDLPDKDYQALWVAVKKVAEYLHVLERARIGVSVVGSDVPHAHVHLIPFDSSSELRVELDLTAKPDHTALQKIAKRITGDR